MGKKDTAFYIRISKSDLARLRAAAEQSRQTVSNFILTLFDRKLKKELPSKKITVNNP